jgi:quinol monooxygenase YgiN
MALSLVLHRVADYDAWRKVYDSDTVAELQKTAGVSSKSVHRMDGDPDNILVLHYFDSVDAAKAFFANPELQDAMKRGGIQGEPRIEFFE